MNLFLLICIKIIFPCFYTCWLHCGSGSLDKKTDFIFAISDFENFEKQFIDIETKKYLCATSIGLHHLLGNSCCPF